jgi:peptidoglycan hydrolase-like protein with peptidoglycan-binding domain
MPLKSHLFRGDKALEACLVQDSAHVTLGAAGVHVSKIHAALVDLDGATVDAAEVSAKRYGPSTASAVLAYKRKRNIINRAYQTQADNIVGKMTIAAMDNELFNKQELVRPRGSLRCNRL